MTHQGRNTLLAVFLFILSTGSAVAMPMLSADGSRLSNLSVNDELYDVMFGDGVVGEVYADVVFDEAREAEARAVSIALGEALNMLDVAAIELEGCQTPSPSPANNSCFILVPMRFEAPATFVVPPLISLDSPWITNGFDVPIEATLPPTGGFTLATYTKLAPTPVPAPSPLTLLCVGFLALLSRGNTLKNLSPLILRK